MLAMEFAPCNSRDPTWSARTLYETAEGSWLTARQVSNTEQVVSKILAQISFRKSRGSFMNSGLDGPKSVWGDGRTRDSGQHGGGWCDCKAMETMGMGGPTHDLGTLSW